MKFYGISQDFGYKEYISLEKAKGSESNLLIVKDDYEPSTGHNFTFYNENSKFSNSFLMKVGKDLFQILKKLTNTKKNLRSLLFLKKELLEDLNQIIILKVI